MTTELCIVDSHCHLDDERYADDTVEAIMERAAEQGVQYMQTICTTKKDFEIIHPMALKHEKLFCSYGIHPHHADTDVVTKEEIVAQARKDKVIAIGETGLDYFYENAPKELQKKSFRAHLEAARELDLPVIIHTRDAEEDTMLILDEALAKGPLKLLFHCFSSSVVLAEYAVKKGIYMSASGIITFKKADAVREGFEITPLEFLLVETDAPYLAPVPHRGKRNEPAYTRVVLEALAEIKGVSDAALAQTTTDNFFKLFNKASR